MSLADLSAILAAPPAPAAAQQASPTPPPADVPALLTAKLPLPVQVRDLLLAPPEGIDAGAQIQAFGASYEIPIELLAQIVETKPAGYSAETLAQLAAQLPAPTPTEVQPEPTKLVDDGPRMPPKKRRGRPKKEDAPAPSSDTLTRAERLALACAAVQGGVMPLTGAEEYVLAGEQGE